MSAIYNSLHSNFSTPFHTISFCNCITSLPLHPHALTLQAYLFILKHWHYKLTSSSSYIDITSLPLHPHTLTLQAYLFILIHWHYKLTSSSSAMNTNPTGMKEFFPGISLTVRKATIPGISWNMNECNKLHRIKTCKQLIISFQSETFVQKLQWINNQQWQSKTQLYL